MATPLYIRSVYSLLSSMCSIDGIIEYAKKYNYKAIGLVDQNVLAGAMSFYKACIKNDIKPIFGLELKLKIDERNIAIVLYAQNDDGYKNLMCLSSIVCTNDDKCLDIETYKKYKSDCFTCLMSDDMPLTYAVDKNLDIEEAINQQSEIFGDDYLVCIVDHDKAINISRDAKIKKILKEKKIYSFAVNRTYYLDEIDYEDYEVLKCIRDHKLLSDPSNSYELGRHFLNPKEFSELYDEDDLKNTDVVASKCNVKLDFKTSLPEYKNNKGISNKDYLVSLCKEGLKRRLKNKVNDEYIKRLDYELGVIIKMNFVDYFLIVYDFILYAKKNNILVGPGRGSCAGSLACYCLGISEIDPLKYGLLFERFLNPERISMPDIDTDFPDDKRDQVIEYVKNKYGENHIAHIITYGTLKAKQVIRDVGRVLNYSTNDIDSVSKLIPSSIDMNLELALQVNPIFKQKINSEEKYRKLYKIAKKLEFLPRHESTHAAGIVMSSKDLNEVVPVIKIESDINSTQYTMEHLEELGLIKMDFLGLRNLGIITEIVEDINSDQTFNLKDIPLDDEKTFKLIDDCNVLGVFQLESNGMQNLIKQMKPKSFEEIGITIALFRPGPMENIPTFLANRANPDKISYIHPDLKPILEDTYGIIVYQEQIMSIARIMAGFTLGKADILRKAMSKKKSAELEKLYPDFIQGCLARGYSKDVSEKVYELIMKFANYGFNKSHSIAYGLVAYQMAYLKANYPLYFYKALLNGVIGSSSKTYDYISECINTKLKVTGVSINDSDIQYKIDNNHIIMPLSIIKDVGLATCNKILEERKNGKFKGYIDCVRRLVNASVEKDAIKNLIYAGALDCLDYNRHSMINALENVLMYANAHKGNNNILNSFDDEPLIDKLNDDKMVLCEYEKDVLGFYFSFNPIQQFKINHNIDTINLYDLANNIGNGSGFGLIKRVKSLRTKKGDMMAFVDLVDERGEISLAVMPNIYSLYSNVLVKGKYVYFEGKIEKQGSCLVRKLTIY